LTTSVSVGEPFDQDAELVESLDLRQGGRIANDAGVWVDSGDRSEVGHQVFGVVTEAFS
jgi:hypothetical protein